MKTEKRNVYDYRKIYGQTILFSFILFLTLTGQDIVIPVFPLYVEKFGGGFFQLGLLLGIFSLASLILSPVIGYFSDLYGRKIFIVLGLFGFGLANLLYSTAQSFNELLLFRILEGATTAGTGAIIDAFIIDVVPVTQRGRFIGIVNGSGFLGVILGPFLGGILVQNNNFYLPFYVSAFFAIIAMFFSIFLLPNDYSKFKNLKKHGSKSIDKVYETTSFKWLISGGLFIFIILLIVRLAGILSWSLLEPAIPIFLYSLNYNSTQVGLYFSCYGITMVIGQLLFGSLSDKYGRKRILQVGLAIYLFGFLLLVNSTNILVFYLSNAINGLSFSLISPTIVSLVADVTKDEYSRGKVMTIYFEVINLADIIGPILGGYIAFSRGFELVLTVSIIIIVIGCTFTFLLRNKEKLNPGNIEPLAQIS